MVEVVFHVKRSMFVILVLRDLTELCLSHVSRETSSGSARYTERCLSLFHVKRSMAVLLVLRDLTERCLSRVSRETKHGCNYASVRYSKFEVMFHVKRGMGVVNTQNDV